ncbi:MAG TPA: gephyrin-like molybdotransferase Glp [Actinomycetota bacterium]
MRSIQEARESILRAVEPLAPIELPLQESHGCVLATDVMAEYDLPPFSSAEVTGYAARAADIHAATEETPVPLRLSSGEPGRPAGGTVGWGEAVAVAAGAPVPAGADCVVPLDRCRVEGGGVAVVAPVESGEFIRPAGRDVRAGETLVPAGRKLSSAEMAILAAAGRPAPPVYPRLRVGVMSIAQDLAEPGRPAAFGQAREAASFAVVGALREAGAVPYRVGMVPPVEGELREAVVTNLARADSFVCTVGASDADLDPEALDVLDVEFDDVAMFPGMTFGFGVVEGVSFFVLPASPVSAFVLFEMLVRPAILRMMGRRDISRPEVKAVLEEGVSGPSGVTMFVPARVEHREGWRATPTGGADPDSFAALVRANGLVMIPPGDTEPAAGDEVRVRIFRPLER